MRAYLISRRQQQPQQIFLAGRMLDTFPVCMTVHKPLNIKCRFLIRTVVEEAVGARANSHNTMVAMPVQNPPSGRACVLQRADNLDSSHWEVPVV